MAELPTATLTSQAARTRFLAEPRAVLGTVDEEGRPHLVPVTFVHAEADGTDHLYIAIDHKPKRTTDLKRLRNIAANPNTSLLVDLYDADWSRLWWARADGTATVTEFSALPATLPATVSELLKAKYPQYAATPPQGPVIDIAVSRWSGWAYAEG